MKRYIIATATLLSLIMTLTSCLREATPNADPEESESVTTVAVSQPIPQTTEKVNTVVTEEREPEPHADVVKWTDAHDDPRKVIMTPDEIEAENDRIRSESSSMIDILEFREYVTGDELRSMIGKNDVPSLPRYDKDDSEITDEHAQSVRSNMAHDLVADNCEVKRGMIVSRANVRSVPDDKPYRKSKDNPYDSIQMTELCVGTPVWLLHSSRDGEYQFIRAYNYFGWVKSDNIATTSDDNLWRSFTSPESFVCVTEPLINISGENVDMGATLPFISEGANGYTVKVPKRDVNGQLVSTEALITYKQGCLGYLPYTYENYLIQAFKYEGTMYGWGGLDNGIDCSGFVANVFKTFGFKFPRDTKDQNTVVGSAIDVTTLKHADVSDILLQSSCPTAVYYTGHTLLFLGYNDSDRRYYFIHAPQIGERVSVTSKKDLSGITYIGHVGGN